MEGGGAMGSVQPRSRGFKRDRGALSRNGQRAWRCGGRSRPCHARGKMQGLTEGVVARPRRRHGDGRGHQGRQQERPQHQHPVCVVAKVVEEEEQKGGSRLKRWKRFLFVSLFVLRASVRGRGSARRAARRQRFGGVPFVVRAPPEAVPFDAEANMPESSAISRSCRPQ